MIGGGGVAPEVHNPMVNAFSGCVFVNFSRKLTVKFLIKGKNQSCHGADGCESPPVSAGMSNRTEIRLSSNLSDFKHFEV